MPENNFYPNFDGEQLGFIFGMIRARMLRTDGMARSQRAVAESILEEIRRQWGNDAPEIEKRLADMAKSLGISI